MHADVHSIYHLGPAPPIGLVCASWNNTVQQRQSLWISGCPTELFWDAGYDLSSPLSLFSFFFFTCLRPSVCPSQNSKPEIFPPSRIFTKPMYCSGATPPPLVMPQVFSRSIMVCVSFQVQNLVSGRTQKLRGIFRGHIRRGPALALGWGSLCSTGLCLSQWKSLPCRAPALAAWRFLPKLPTWQRRVRNRMNKIEFEREGGNAGRRK